MLYYVSDVFCNKWFWLIDWLIDIGSFPISGSSADKSMILLFLTYFWSTKSSIKTIINTVTFTCDLVCYGQVPADGWHLTITVAYKVMRECCGVDLCLDDYDAITEKYLYNLVHNNNIPLNVNSTITNSKVQILFSTVIGLMAQPYIWKHLTISNMKLVNSGFYLRDLWAEQKVLLDTMRW